LDGGSGEPPIEFADIERPAQIQISALFFTQNSTSIYITFHQTRLGFADASML
jgi:hypothetical protein